MSEDFFQMLHVVLTFEFCHVPWLTIKHQYVNTAVYVIVMSVKVRM